ncbi:glutamine-hydrolyzing carbamoyl-phosphate synthase small subunit [Micropruina glycogenica]|jgi:carbamoyl-phosphate synthase small subunit|uniref:Carbamoyl phosphate synthase small chain n=1 Tax=Micropruina glycogenica TaxID=75385 RepID=A0A2N9JED0_9ACTN|nr:glutamine-hydrolyzing carbamoyl-phosphate synthase small subunit [Micropruina glycogenica]SPD86477.1 pyrimidine-specific carbamoyl-phosphate synthetase (small subunit, glutaminase subunit) [Micropruina glycogenica]
MPSGFFDHEQTPALLVLEDGRSFRGVSFGATGEAFGEAVFSTGMSGYQETLTDPSYHRQVVVATAPHIGNTGWNDEDDESSRIWVAGYVVRDLSRVRSNWRSNRSLDEELRNQGVVGIAEIDTRALTRHLRERGAMRVGISTVELDPAKLLDKVLQTPSMAGSDLVADVTLAEPEVVPAVGNKQLTVAAIDLGIKDMTPTRMAERGIEVHVLPASVSLDELRELAPDGVFFSNGPGDPATADAPMELLQGVLDQGIPYFGICFGNQIFGRALGFGTYKLKYGHRGINQPVKDLRTGKVEITAQNHGFAVDAPLDRAQLTPWGHARVSHVCLNDDVVEGLELTDDDGNLLAFSVQYHPEAAAGPHDSAYLFDRFVDVMQRRKRSTTDAQEN